MSADRPRYVRQSAPLSAKLSGGNALDPAAMAQAKAVVEARAQQYPATVLVDVGLMEHALAAADGDPEQCAAHLQHLSGIAHDMSGQGATYGYPLITKMAASLVEFSRSCAGSDEDREVIGIHLQALRAVAEGDLTGDGGPAGRELVDALRQAREHASHSKETCR
jgi:hypothetical protein